MKLLSREDFKLQVFKRDGNRCVICAGAAVDAHHLIERKLFHDGGYYLDNGVSLCEVHHLEAEKTTISCTTLREKAKIKSLVLPQGFDPQLNYDKWGNIVISESKRLPGPIFNQENVQKILKLAKLLHLFQ